MPWQVSAYAVSCGFSRMIYLRLLCLLGTNQRSYVPPARHTPEMGGVVRRSACPLRSLWVCSLLVRYMGRLLSRARSQLAKKCGETCAGSTKILGMGRRRDQRPAVPGSALPLFLLCVCGSDCWISSKQPEISWASGSSSWVGFSCSDFTLGRPNPVSARVFRGQCGLPAVCAAQQQQTKKGSCRVD